MSERVKIPNKEGHLLHAQIDFPIQQQPLAFAIFAHCFTCSSNFTVVRQITTALNQAGIAVVRFDFTGLGQSEGEFEDSHFSANVEDLFQVHAYVSEKHMAPSLIIGHSLGGAAALVVAQQLEAIKAVVTIGSPSSVSHVKHLFKVEASQEVHEKINVYIGGRPFVINPSFIADFDKIDLLKVVRQMKKPLLILHAPFDEIVDIRNAQELYLAAFHPKSFISLDKADHLLSNKADSLYAGQVIATWAKRYVENSTLPVKPIKSDKVVGHLLAATDNFTTRIQTPRHAIVADEPIELGGDDLGPAPYELLMSALAACTVMTLQLYARRKKWALDEVYVYIHHEKKSVEENGSTKAVDFFEKQLRFVGKLDETQRVRLIEIADKCPVNKTLAQGSLLTTKEML